MFATLLPSMKFAPVALALGLASSTGMAADPVLAGFDRLLAYEATTVHAPAATAGPADPLVAAMIVPLRDGVAPARPIDATDPVAASFARMLNHAPTWTYPALPEGAGSDPLIAAVVWPLLRTRQHTVASAAPIARQ